VEIGGRPARCWEDGEEHGRTLLLLHGVGDAEANWREVMPALAESFHVIAPDLPGFGASAPLADISAGAQIVWLKALLEALEIEQAVPIGVSFGALLARLFASAHPDIAPAVILVNGGALPNISRGLSILSRLPVVNRLLFGALARSATSRGHLETIVASKAVIDDALLANAQANQPALARLMQGLISLPLPEQRMPLVPIMLLWGESDPTAPLEDAEHLSATLPGAVLSPIADCGQLPQLEVSEVFAFQVIHFLERLSRPSHISAGPLPTKTAGTRPSDFEQTKPL
jgi:pimeloyl-ACP methyl ester carboxylesterase